MRLPTQPMEIYLPIAELSANRADSARARRRRGSAVGHVRRRRRVSDDAAADLLGRHAVGRRRYRNQPDHRLVGLRHHGALAPRQRRFSDRCSDLRRRHRRCVARRLHLQAAQRCRPDRPGGVARLRAVSRGGRLPDGGRERGRDGAPANARPAARPTSTPGYTACRSGSAFGGPPLRLCDPALRARFPRGHRRLHHGRRRRVLHGPRR